MTLQNMFSTKALIEGDSTAQRKITPLKRASARGFSSMYIGRSTAWLISHIGVGLELGSKAKSEQKMGREKYKINQVY